MSCRRDSLSFGHHAEVGALAQAEQDFWLRKAAEPSWPVANCVRGYAPASANAMRARPARESKTVALARLAPVHSKQRTRQ
jgi:phage tail sheath gpL-like